MSAKSRRNLLNLVLLACQPLLVVLMRRVNNELFLETPLGYTSLWALDTFIMSFIAVPEGWSKGKRVMRLISLQCSILAVLTIILDWHNHTSIDDILSPLILGVFAFAPIMITWLMKD